MHYTAGLLLEGSSLGHWRQQYCCQHFCRIFRQQWPRHPFNMVAIAIYFFIIPTFQKLIKVDFVICFHKCYVFWRLSNYHFIPFISYWASHQKPQSRQIWFLRFLCTRRKGMKVQEGDSSGKQLTTRVGLLLESPCSGKSQTALATAQSTTPSPHVRYWTLQPSRRKTHHRNTPASANAQSINMVL